MRKRRQGTLEARFRFLPENGAGLGVQRANGGRNPIVHENVFSVAIMLE